MSAARKGFKRQSGYFWKVQNVRKSCKHGDYSSRIHVYAHTCGIIISHFVVCVLLHAHVHNIMIVVLVVLVDSEL